MLTFTSPLSYIYYSSCICSEEARYTFSVDIDVGIGIWTDASITAGYENKGLITGTFLWIGAID